MINLILSAFMGHLPMGTATLFYFHSDPGLLTSGNLSFEDYYKGDTFYEKIFPDHTNRIPLFSTVWCFICIIKITPIIDWHCTHLLYPLQYCKLRKAEIRSCKLLYFLF